jgi:hypothetical protein
MSGTHTFSLTKTTPTLTRETITDNREGSTYREDVRGSDGMDGEKKKKRRTEKGFCTN